ncbi:MAG: patatin-like phospholipase family protein [Muribaculaceae bacterium]|nr:patatin-like phospholipase family protein [Muribaculaceae bacterium]
MNSYIEDLLEKFGLRTKAKLGMAFAGGGAKGFSHIGVLQAFERFDLSPQIVSGVSAGSIAAVLYAAGLTPYDMIDCFAEANSFNDFSQLSVPKESFFRLNRFGKLLESWLPVKNLEETKIPVVICATNLEKGTSVGWCKGEIVPRVIASCSIPIIFKPVKINGYHYVDGGVLRNLPAWAIRDYCKVLVGSNCSPLDRSYSYKQNILNVAMRTYTLMSKANALQDIKMCDYVVSPLKVVNTKTFDLSALRKNVQYGYDVACKVIEVILRKNK